MPCPKWDGRYKSQGIVLGAVLTVGNDGGFLAINNKGGTVVANVGSGDQGEGLLSCTITMVTLVEARPAKSRRSSPNHNCPSGCVPHTRAKRGMDNDY